MNASKRIDQPASGALLRSASDELRIEQDLLACVARLADALSADAPDAEAGGRLSDRCVSDLRKAGLLRMRLCRELGGLELSTSAQIRVLSALAEIDTSSAWCIMMANSAVAVLGSNMPGPAIERVFADGVPICSIVAAPGGRAMPTGGGHRLTGTWRLATGIHHAEWVYATALIDGDPSRLLTCSVPARDVEILDTWRVVGLMGTGSHDFVLNDYFLPHELSARIAKPHGQVRGGRRYDLPGMDRVESYEHLAFALGVTRRCLRDLRCHLASTPSNRQTADREVVQTELARAAVQLQALEALTEITYRRIDAAAEPDGENGPGPSLLLDDVHLPRTLAVLATENALAVVQLAFHRAGAASMNAPNTWEKLLRDMSVASTHVMVDDMAVSTYGEHLLETATQLTTPASEGASRAC